MTTSQYQCKKALLSACDLSAGAVPAPQRGRQVPAQADAQAGDLSAVPAQAGADRRTRQADEQSGGATVALRNGVFVDRDMAPESAATILLAALGAVYVDRLIDALIDELEIKRG